MNGLLRVRTFCQDDAHIFVTPEQIEDEITLALKMIDHVYQVFGFEYEIELSTRPDDYMGDLALWNQAESALENVLNNLNYPYKINEGDGAFYGPKIDIHIKDAIKRSHQCATVQLDFQLPEKFDLTYINEENEKLRPVVIHRAVFGSIDRFLGILIEHFGVSKLQYGYAEKIYEQLRKAGIRVSIDRRNEKLGRKIRDAQIRKIPYVLILGDQEQKDQTVTVRRYKQTEQITISLEKLLNNILQEISEKSLPKN